MSKRIRFHPDEQVPLEAVDLHPRLCTRLRDALSIDSLRSMQAVVHAHIQRTASLGVADDLVLCAPTGSGKTLAYALPIVHALLDRVIPRLRAVVVVPTRDLAIQVAHVFRVLTAGAPVAVALATGAQGVAAETRAVRGAEILVATPGRLTDHVKHTSGVRWDAVRFLVLDESDRLLQESYDDWLQTIMPYLNSNRSNNNSTGNSKLGSSDNLDSNRANGNNSSSAVSALKPPTTGLLALAIHPDVSSRSGSAYTGVSQERVRKMLVSATQSYNPTHMVHLDMRSPTVFEVAPDTADGPSHPDAAEREGPSPSATTTTTTAPLHQGEEYKHTLPSTLTETGWIVRDVQGKPAALLYLLGWILPVEGEKSFNLIPSTAPTNSSLSSSSSPSLSPTGTTTTLVFTNSVEAAHRLSRLLEICQYSLGREGHVLEMSSDLSSERRQQVIKFVKNNNHDNTPASSTDEERSTEEFTPERIANGANSLVVVCSDVLSRGMDIFTVDKVINYDTPVQVRTYVHRAGRTARAGRNGNAMTLLLSKQVHHFRAMVYEAERGNCKVKTTNLDPRTLFSDDIEDFLEASLGSLKRVLTRERFNLVPKDQPIPAYILHELYSRTMKQSSQGDGNYDDEYAETETGPYAYKMDATSYPSDDIDGWGEEEDNAQQKQSRKRQRDVHMEYSAGAEGHEHHGQYEPAATILDGKAEVTGNDTLTDLLFTQIGQNLMKTESVSR